MKYFQQVESYEGVDGKIPALPPNEFKGEVDARNQYPQEVISRKILPLQNISNKRRGVGNRVMTRPSFLKSNVLPRQAVDFDRAKQLDNERFGQLVRFDDNTLDKLFEVKVPDMQDTTWLAEKTRLTNDYLARGFSREQIERELKLNKPLGREQRTITENRNIGSSSLDMSSKLKEIKEEVVNGNATSRAQQAALAGQIALVLNDTNAVEALTRLQLTDLGVALARLDVPRTYKQLGIGPRYIDNAFYLANAGIINMFIFSQVRHNPGLDYMHPLFSAVGVAGGAAPVPIRFPTLLTQLRAPMPVKRFLDLENLWMVNVTQLRAAAAADPDGYDGPNFSIDPANR